MYTFNILKSFLLKGADHTDLTVKKHSKLAIVLISRDRLSSFTNPNPVVILKLYDFPMWGKKKKIEKWEFLFIQLKSHKRVWLPDLNKISSFVFCRRTKLFYFDILAKWSWIIFHCMCCISLCHYFKLAPFPSFRFMWLLSLFRAMPGPAGVIGTNPLTLF